VDNIIQEDLLFMKKVKRRKFNKNFKCKACGKCCKVEGYIHVSNTDIKNISRHLKMTEKQFRDKYVRWVHNIGRVLPSGVNSSCIFLKNGKCGIYQARPVQCSSFPYWDMITGDNDEWEYAKSYCKGCREMGEIIIS